MVQYIDKSAAVAEIERIKNTEYNENSISNDIACCALDMAIDAINTFEVKEVDIEKKKMEWIEQLCKYFKANYLYVSGHESFISDFRRYAKNLK